MLIVETSLAHDLIDNRTAFEIGNAATSVHYKYAVGYIATGRLTYYIRFSRKLLRNKYLYFVEPNDIIQIYLKSVNAVKPIPRNSYEFFRSLIHIEIVHRKSKIFQFYFFSYNITRHILRIVIFFRLHRTFTSGTEIFTIIYWDSRKEPSFV